MDQIHLFDYCKEKYKITKPIRLIELFGGIGSQAMALERLGADFEHYRLVEFDKYATKSYNAIHKTNFEPTDITKIDGDFLGIEDKEHYTYLLTYSFPCQDLSVAGLRRGMAKGDSTRSGLLWEVERLLQETKELPDVLLMENVPGVHDSENIGDFRKWLDFLEDIGYSNYYEDLNAKDYGVAQNRERCFCVSILGDYFYKFPQPIELTKVMKDYLEDKVDEKYYIKSEKAQKLIDKLISDGTLQDRETCDLSINEPRIIDNANCIKARYDSGISNLRADGSGVIEKTSVLLTNMGSSDEEREPSCKETDIACTLLQRDYKGLNNYSANGVIEHGTKNTRTDG